MEHMEKNSLSADKFSLEFGEHLASSQHSVLICTAVEDGGGQERDTFTNSNSTVASSKQSTQGKPSEQKHFQYWTVGTTVYSTCLSPTKVRVTGKKKKTSKVVRKNKPQMTR